MEVAAALTQAGAEALKGAGGPSSDSDSSAGNGLPAARSFEVHPLGAAVIGAARWTLQLALKGARAMVMRLDGQRAQMATLRMVAPEPPPHPPA